MLKKALELLMISCHSVMGFFVSKREQLASLEYTRSVDLGRQYTDNIAV
jgi:hypothetical protein